jgi:hypothetical protein
VETGVVTEQEEVPSLPDALVVTRAQMDPVLSTMDRMIEANQLLLQASQVFEVAANQRALPREAALGAQLAELSRQQAKNLEGVREDLELVVDGGMAEHFLTVLSAAETTEESFSEQYSTALGIEAKVPEAVRGDFLEITKASASLHKEAARLVELLKQRSG